MKYVHPDHNVVINAQGGYAVLERLGFKTEGDEMAKKKKPAATKPAVKEETPVRPAKSRNELMQEVKSRGIKNFRVMNKAELIEIFNGASQTRISEIQVEAVDRWKSGWGTKK